MRFVEPQFPLISKPNSVIRVKCWETYFQLRPFSAMLNVKAAGVVLIKDTLPWLWSSAGESWFNHTSILLLPYFPFTYFAHPAQLLFLQAARLILFMSHGNRMNVSENWDTPNQMVIVHIHLLRFALLLSRYKDGFPSS